MRLSFLCCAVSVVEYVLFPILGLVFCSKQPLPAGCVSRTLLLTVVHPQLTATPASVW